MTRPLRLLLIEDSEDDAELIRLELERAGFVVQARRVEAEATLRAALAERWDVIISDFAMPHFDGMRAFPICRSMAPGVPFLFVSGALGEERAVAAMLAGARDYIVKGNLGRLGPAVVRELAAAEQNAARERHERRLALALDATGAGVFEHALPLVDPPFVGDRLAAILGVLPEGCPPPAGLRAAVEARVHPEDWPELAQAYARLLAGADDRLVCELRVRHADGRWIECALFAAAVARDARGRVTQVLGVVLDVSARRRLESQFRQAQKLEAVGRLAGGVAHDFNNLLTGILSFGEFVLRELPPGPVHDDQQQVLACAQRAADLTRQLLAFSRQQPVRPRVIQVEHVLQQVERLLRRLIGEDIVLHATAARGLWPVKVDPGALEQVLMNLAVNARDAMPEGGTLSIGVGNVTLDSAAARAAAEAGAEPACPPGDYVAIAVRDTGTGITPEVRRRLFEPFFTTKAPGEGTGLGLSTCYGIVRQAEGLITCESAPGAGATFTVYLPRAAGRPSAATRRLVPADLGGTETILVVEDDESIRQLASRVLAAHGYTVQAAPDATAAEVMLAAAGGRVDLLLTDVVMPGVGGPALAERLLERDPRLRVVFMSGYTAQAAPLVERIGAPLMEKPFTPETLARVVRQALDAPARAPGAEAEPPG